MSWKLKRKAQALIAGEEGIARKDWGGRVSIALVYPNTYAVGMSNLGFQTIYEHLNALPDAVCERVFLPDPEAMSPFMDAIAVGEGEELVAEIVEAYKACRDDGREGLKQRVIDRLKTLRGIYVPAAYDVDYTKDGTIGAVTPREPGVPALVVKRRLRDVNRFETRSSLKTPKAEYGHMALLEVGKGCGRGCRFCLEGQIYRPVRHRSLEALRESVAQIAKESKRVGLVGACVSDYPWIGELMKMLEEYGVEVSISSLRADSLTEELVASLQRGGHRTLTMAPEACTERLRRSIRKAITDEQLMAACDLLRKYAIPNLKCYFMIGQPTETMADVEAIPDLSRRMLERLRVPGPDGHPFGKLTLSVSSFVPKPWTPFQWAAFDEPRDLEAKLEAIKGGARRIQVRVVHENPREAGLQALLARGDRRVADFLEIAARMDGDWRRALREWNGDPAFYARRERAAGEVMPWDHFDVGVKKAGLLREWQRAGLGEPVTA